MSTTGTWDVSNFLRKTPCVRSSLLFGIGAGLGLGSSVFLFTRHVKKSCDLAVGSFALISTGLWAYCSHDRRQQQRNLELVVQTLEKKNKDNKEKIER